MQNSAENSERGFTLIELLIAMVIALIVITSLANAFISQRKTYDVQEQITEMMQGARAALEMIGSEVRMAGYDPIESGAAGIVSATATSIRFTADTGGEHSDGVDNDGDGDIDEADEADGVVDDSNEDITYSYDSPNLQIDRNTGGNNQPFAENIQSCSFLYFDSNGNAAATVADIRQIEITVTARTSKPDPNYTHPQYSDGYRRYTLTSYITPPNLAF